MEYTMKSDKGNRALFFLPKVGRCRVYRSDKDNPAKGLKLLVYRSKKYAQEICDEINRAYNDDFKVVIH